MTTTVGDKAIAATAKAMLKVGIPATLYARPGADQPGSTTAALQSFSITSTPLLHVRQPLAVSGESGVRLTAPPSFSYVIVPGTAVLGVTPHAGAEIEVTGLPRRRVVQADPIFGDERVVAWKLWLEG